MSKLQVLGKWEVYDHAKEVMGMSPEFHSH